MKLNQLSLPATILVGCVILGGFYYATQTSKQNSIERQQQSELEAKKELDKKEYSAKQKTACLDIYQAEGKKWNNVVGWSYDDKWDSCEVTYKEAEPKADAECEKIAADYKKETGETYPILTYLHCIDGTFSKTF